MSLIALLVFVIIIALIYWALHRIAGAFGLPPPILVVIDVLLVVIVVLYLLQWAGLWHGSLGLRP